MPLDRTAYYADAGTAMDIVAITTAMAAAEADQIALRAVYTYKPANAAALAALTGMRVGDLAVQTDTKVTHRYTGTAWKPWTSDWATYTSTLTNFVIGTGGAAENTTTWRYHDGFVEVRFKFVLGTGGGATAPASSANNPLFTLPVASVTPQCRYETYSCGASAYDTSAVNAYSAVVHAWDLSTTTACLFGVGTAGVMSAITTTVPFTWAAGDMLVGTCTYVPA